MSDIRDGMKDAERVSVYHRYARARVTPIMQMAFNILQTGVPSEAETSKASETTALWAAGERT